jgi:hypothetical protein
MRSRLRDGQRPRAGAALLRHRECDTIVERLGDAVDAAVASLPGAANRHRAFASGPQASARKAERDDRAQGLTGEGILEAIRLSLRSRGGDAPARLPEARYGPRMIAESASGALSMG